MYFDNSECEWDMIGRPWLAYLGSIDNPKFFE